MYNTMETDSNKIKRCDPVKGCTCKMKVDTHKSVGVYFYRCIIKMERM